MCKIFIKVHMFAFLAMHMFASSIYGQSLDPNVLSEGLKKVEGNVKSNGKIFLSIIFVIVFIYSAVSIISDLLSWGKEQNSAKRLYISIASAIISGGIIYFVQSKL